MTNLNKIDHSSRLYRAFHEAGHYVAACFVDAEVQSLEVFPSEGGVCRVKHSGAVHQRQLIAAGGFAVEYLLYKCGRLVTPEASELSQKEFVNLCMQNAWDDKKTFFGGDHSEDGYWPEEMDKEFMKFGYEQLVNRLAPLMPAIENLATQLEARLVLTGVEAEEILTS